MTDLTGAERRWLTGQHVTPTRIDTKAVTRAGNNLIETVGGIVTGIHNATATSPPQRPNNQTGRRGSDPSDPALAAIDATMHAIDMACTRLGHLLDDCHLCDALNPGPGHNDRQPTLARLTGADLTELSDHLTGIGPTSPHAVTKATEAASHIVSRQATAYCELWHDMWRNGAEPQLLRDLTADLVTLASRARGVKHTVAQWIPGVHVRLCLCGCGAHAPAGRRVTDACEKRRKRAAADGAA